MTSPQSSRNVCVFCSSSSTIDSHFLDTAHEFGTHLGKSGATLVFGGADVGMMGVLARAVHSGGGKVVGVIPEIFVEKGIAYEEADELIVVLEGTLEVRINDDVYTVGPNHTVVVPPNVPHGFTIVGESDARILGFFPIQDPFDHTQFLEGGPPQAHSE